VAISLCERDSILKKNTVIYKNIMRKYILSMTVLISLMQMAQSSFAQVPCNQPVFRQFDFWIGEWDVYNTNGKKAGDSKISLIRAPTSTRALPIPARVLINTTPRHSNGSRPGLTM
jgi:hypothetical protein